MHSKQFIWSEMTGWSPGLPTLDGSQLLLLFCDRSVLYHWKEIWPVIHKSFPRAELIGCTGAGEILGTSVSDHSFTLTAIEFHNTPFKIIHHNLRDARDAVQSGFLLGKSLPHQDLRHLFVLSDGLHINGSDFAVGLQRSVPADVSITGGLAGDGERFDRTVLIHNNHLLENHVLALALCGDAIKVGYGSFGGWNPFGIDRIVTRAEGNILYELDNRPALELYKQYLGNHSKNLPASGLLFPLCIKTRGDSPELVRTVLTVDEAENAMVFAGNIPTGSHARLMMANLDSLVDGAIKSAQMCLDTCPNFREEPADLAILVSCVGRRLVLNQRVEEELEEVREVLGAQTNLTGFYSYGEICPVSHGGNCELHNQTMTITLFTERPVREKNTA